MAPPSADIQVKVSSEAAETFIGYYYQALNNNSPLKQFYSNSCTRNTVSADISINGKVLATPEEYSTLLDAQGTDVRYEIESMDVHVANPVFSLGAPDNIHENDRVERKGGRMSIVVTIMGKILFGKERSALQKMFHETFVLVPNWNSLARNPPQGIKRWLIMSQNFRSL